MVMNVTRTKRTRWLTQRILGGAIGLYVLVSALCLLALHRRAQETNTADSHPTTQLGEDFKIDKPIIRNVQQGSTEPVVVPSKEQTVVDANAAATVSTPQQIKQPPQDTDLPSKVLQISPPKLEPSSWKFDREAAEARLANQGADSIRQPITAYVEGRPYPPPEYILDPGDRGDMKRDRDSGKPMTYKTPLPLRTQRPEDLVKVVYPKVQTCQDMPQGFPVDQGLQFDEQGEPIVWNVGDNPTPPDFPQQELPHCPVEADPFLPWVHDLFPSPDGKLVHVLAQNKRRCRTGKKFTENVNRLLPQVALMQPISVQRLSQQDAIDLAPSLWQDKSDTATPRYRIVPLEKASADGLYTRFICRFHSIDFATGNPIVLEETLSTYPFNYEMAAYRKGHAMLFTPKGKDNKFFWTSNLHFTCPVPNHLQLLVASGTSVLSDGSPTLWVDIIPMRTPTRYLTMHLGADMIGPPEGWMHGARVWNVTQEMGEAHVLPAVAASGRWANLPVCKPNQPAGVEAPVVNSDHEKTSKPHFLSACLWASAEFKTRGMRKAGNSDTLERLHEWLTFHFDVGFDHVYVYDNSAAHTNTSNLEPILRRFGDRVTRIEWPSIVCNNNVPAHDNTGERSSQYAAENSCRTRYAPFTEWIAAFDTDEYFVPMGKYDSLRDVLRDAGKAGANILSFRSSRGRMRQEASVMHNKGRIKLPNATFLETYNCDSAGSPKPTWGDRARKQIYRADYVLYHFVHYSTVTQGYQKTYAEGYKRHQFSESEPSERVVDELNEAVLVHTKSLPEDMTNFYESRCRNDYGKKWQGCWVAYPWPNGETQEKVEDENGMEYNCFVNRKVDEVWVPRLRKALESYSIAEPS